MNDGHRISPWFLGTWTLSVCVFTVAPLLAVIAVSFTPLDYISLPSSSLSLRWYKELLDHPVYLTAGINSIVLALASAAISVLLGLLSALAVVRYRFFLREPLRLLVTSPLFVPMVMSGLAILMFFSKLGWDSQFLRLVIGHTALTVPYVLRTVSASLTGFDTNQELAAQNLGASPVKAFLLITLPQLMPGLAAGGIFAFVVSFDNVGLSIFLVGATYKTLPVELLAHVENDNDPMSAALSVVMLIVAMVVVLVTERLVGLQRLFRP